MTPGHQPTVPAPYPGDALPSLTGEARGTLLAKLRPAAMWVPSQGWTNQVQGPQPDGRFRVSDSQPEARDLRQANKNEHSCLSIDILKGGTEYLLSFHSLGWFQGRQPLHIWQHSSGLPEREEGTLMLVAICFAHCVAMEWDPLQSLPPRPPAPTLSSACLLPVKTSKNKFN